MEQASFSHMMAASSTLVSGKTTFKKVKVSSTGLQATHTKEDLSMACLIQDKIKKAL